MSDDYTNTEPVTPHAYTYIEDVGYVCNDCGAHGEKEDEIKHYPGCTPGEAARWEKFYSEPEPDEFDWEQYADHQYDGVDFDEPVDDDPDPYAGTYSEE